MHIQSHTPFAVQRGRLDAPTPSFLGFSWHFVKNCLKSIAWNNFFKSTSFILLLVVYEALLRNVVTFFFLFFFFSLRRGELQTILFCVTISNEVLLQFQTLLRNFEPFTKHINFHNNTRISSIKPLLIDRSLPYRSELS